MLFIPYLNRTTIVIVFLLALVACGGGSGGSAGNVPPEQEDPVVAIPENIVPTLDAGEHQNVTEGDNVTLNATASDADGTITGFSWDQIQGPTVALSDPNSASPSFTAPPLDDNIPVNLTFEVTVTDNDNASTSSQVAVFVEVRRFLISNITSLITYSLTIFK